MASYNKNAFTNMTLVDYSLLTGRKPSDYCLETIVVREPRYEQAVRKFDEEAKRYEAVIGLQEGPSNVPFIFLGFTVSDIYYLIRGTGVRRRGS